MELMTVMIRAMAVSCGKLPLFHRSSKTLPTTGFAAPARSAEAVNSPTMKIKSITQPAARPGIASGSSTRVNVVRSEAPKTREASLSSWPTSLAGPCDRHYPER